MGGHPRYRRVQLAYAPAQRLVIRSDTPQANDVWGTVSGQGLQHKCDLYCCRKMVLAHGEPLHRVVVRLNIQDQLEARVQNMCEGPHRVAKPRARPAAPATKLRSRLGGTFVLSPHVSGTTKSVVEGGPMRD